MFSKTDQKITKRGVLERERDDVFDSFDGCRQGISWETLADDDLDASNFVCRAPVTLSE